MDRAQAIERLNAALGHQLMSALRFTFLAGSAEGFAVQFVAAGLWRFAERELGDTRRLVEKIVALGGTPETRVSGTLPARAAGRARGRAGRSGA